MAESELNCFEFLAFKNANVMSLLNCLCGNEYELGQDQTKQLRISNDTNFFE